MRVPKVRLRPITKSGCVICKKYGVDCKAGIEVESLRITRSLRKILDKFSKDFIILENYRCMPLLGDEENVPNWSVHIVKFTVVSLEKAFC